MFALANWVLHPWCTEALNLPNTIFTSPYAIRKICWRIPHHITGIHFIKSFTFCESTHCHVLNVYICDWYHFPSFWFIFVIFFFRFSFFYLFSIHWKGKNQQTGWRQTTRMNIVSNENCSQFIKASFQSYLWMDGVYIQYYIRHWAIGCQRRNGTRYRQKCGGECSSKIKCKLIYHGHVEQKFVFLFFFSFFLTRISFKLAQILELMNEVLQWKVICLQIIVTSK